MSDSLDLVVCGAPLAARATEVAKALIGLGWSVTVVASPAARAWLDQSAIEAVTGRAEVHEHRQPDQARRGPRPGAVVACPLTLSTGSKMALGIMDTYASGVLCEALACRTPITAVATLSNRLWPHPAWAGHLRTLTDAGVTFVNPISGAGGLRGARGRAGAAVRLHLERNADADLAHGRRRHVGA